MTAESAASAWMEKPDGSRVPVEGNLSLGRTPVSDLVLPDERVSRRHALVHAQGDSEFWLVDHGSRNGTYVNERRVLQPVRLRDGDRLRLGPFVLVFRQPGGGPGLRDTVITPRHTLVDLHQAACWLLVADVEGSTALGQAVPPDEFAMLMGGWFQRCQEMVEGHGGTLNKYLGDGFLAFGRTDAPATPGLSALVLDLRRLQEEETPPFRFALHHGEVLLGGGGTLGEDSLSGAAVTFVFRMEKVAARLGERCLISASAAALLKGAALALRPLGEEEVPSFAGRHPFFAL